MLIDVKAAIAQELDRVRMRERLPAPKYRQRVRERSGLSQSALARAIHVDPATISRWESGEREPDDAHLAPYLDALERLAREVAP